MTTIRSAPTAPPSEPALPPGRLRPSPRVLSLAASIGWRHATANPVRALLLAWRVLPAPLRAVLRVTGPYGRATVLWGAGERDAALTALAASPRRLAAFALAVDQPDAAAAALARLPEHAGPAPRWQRAWPGNKASPPRPSPHSTEHAPAQPAACAPPSPPSRPTIP